MWSHDSILISCIVRSHMGIGEYIFTADWQAEVDEERGEALLRDLDCEEKAWPQVDL